MAVELATAYISLVPSAQGIQSAIAKELNLDNVASEAGASAGKKLGSSLLGNASDVGKKLVEVLGIAALGVAAFKSATDVEDANNIIARSTGATGKALEGLEGSFRKVASGTAASFETVSTTLAELSQRTGLTGKALEGLTSEVVSFNRITKDAPVTVASLTAALAGFNVPANEMGKVLDHLFVISQKTGVPLADLLSTLQTAGPVARQFGFSVEFTAGFLAQLNKAGVDANSIIPGLRKAFTEFAKAGEDPAAGLRKTLTSMQELLAAGQVAEARQLAIQLFGPRGVGLVDAAIAGKVSIDALNQTIDVSGAGILDTAKKTGTLSGALGILKNNLKLALAEFATPAIEAANSALRSVLPTIQSLGRDFATLPDGVKLAAAGLVGITTLAGPIGQLGQGIDGLTRVASGLGSAFQLSAVRGLELIDSIKAVGLAQAAAGIGTFGLLAGVSALIVAFEASDGPYERITANANKYATALIRTALASGDQGAALATLKTDLAGIDRNIAALIAREKELDQERGSGKRSIEETNRLYGETAALLLDQQTRHDGLTKKIRELTAARKDQEAVDKATATSLGAYNVQVLTGGDATAAFVQLTSDAQKALTDFNDALLANAGGAVGYQQSLINIDKAQKDYNDTVAEFGAESPEAIDKQLALKEAQLQGVSAAQSADDAHQKLVDGLTAGTTSYDAEIARLQGLIRLHPENAAGYQLEIDKLNTAKSDIEQLPKTASTKYTFDYDPGPLNTIIDQLSKIPGNVVQQAVAFGRLPFGAKGGIFTAPFIGSEFGQPEAVLPLDDPARSFQVLAQTGLLDGLQAASSVTTSGLTIEHAVFGDRNVIPDLDYWTRTRMAGV